MRGSVQGLREDRSPDLARVALKKRGATGGASVFRRGQGSRVLEHRVEPCSGRDDQELFESVVCDVIANEFGEVVSFKCAHEERPVHRVFACIVVAASPLEEEA